MLQLRMKCCTIVGRILFLDHIPGHCSSRSLVDLFDNMPANNKMKNVSEFSSEKVLIFCI